MDYIFSSQSILAGFVTLFMYWLFWGREEHNEHEYDDDSGTFTRSSPFWPTMLARLAAVGVWAVSIILNAGSIEEDLKRDEAMLALGSTMAKVGESGFYERCTFNGNIAPESWIASDLHPCRSIGPYRIWAEARLGKRAATLPERLVLGMVNQDQSVTQIAWLQLADRITPAFFQHDRTTSNSSREEILVYDAELRKAAGLPAIQ